MSSLSATPSRKTARLKQKLKQTLEPNLAQSLEAVLREEVAQGRLQRDPAQTRVARELDRLRERLIEECEEHRFLKYLTFSNSKTRYKTRYKTSEGALRGLYLWGKPGSGKSMLMDMFFQSVEASPALSSLTRRRTHFLPFMEEMHAAIERLNKSRVRDPIASLAVRVAKESRLLCFDELVVEDIADAMLLGRLFAKLFASFAKRGVVLVATSNFAPEDLYKDGFKRDNFLPMLEILRQAVVSLPVRSAADYRSVALAKQGRDLWFRGRTGGKRMLDAFAQFIEQQDENQLNENQLLACEGRPIMLLRVGTPSERLRARGFARDVVCCDFADLCQKARGVRDYNALLARADVLFLADFPVLDETQRNAAKRFMRLIDLFYERRALVLCHSPAASPRALYSGDSHAQEFPRTASRLEEMLARAHALLEPLRATPSCEGVESA